MCVVLSQGLFVSGANFVMRLVPVRSTDSLSLSLTLGLSFHSGAFDFFSALVRALGPSACCSAVALPSLCRRSASWQSIFGSLAPLVLLAARCTPPRGPLRQCRAVARTLAAARLCHVDVRLRALLHHHAAVAASNQQPTTSISCSPKAARRSHGEINQTCSI